MCYDCTFPPERSSLGSFTTGDLEETLKNLVWSTPEEIYGNRNYYLFKDNVTPYDVAQGYIGNCYFLSAASALAERVEVMQDLFHEDTKTTDTAFYTIDLFIEGQRTPVVIDHYIPVYQDSEQPAFS